MYMGLTADTKATAVTAAVAMTAGLALILYGVVHNDPARSLPGAALITTALTLIALISIKRWVTDTREEQHQLAQAVREAQDERAKYRAAKAALENEHLRRLRDASADRARTAATLIAEREAIAAEFEEKRAALICQTLAEFAELMRSQKSQPSSGSVIPFPVQAQERSAERERSREHGVAGP